MLGPDVDGEPEKFRADGARQIRVTVATPPIAKINRDGVVAGERLDIGMGIFALADAELGFTARVGGIAGIATLVAE
jgi:hypothetical protein